ncbi:hypothetical protein [Parafrankia sp. FMc2]|uniref:hypothetical protein n=1 Tax=Parafrankia sp. FMc2 TaxID=3233196 RepID=UPI0034D5878A
MITWGGADSCPKLAGVEVAESDSYVWIAYWVHGKGQICEAIARPPVAGLVELAEPLGHRQLLHAPMSHPELYGSG